MSAVSIVKVTTWSEMAVGAPALTSTVKRQKEGQGAKGLPLPGKPASLETAFLGALPVASTCTSSTFSCCGIYLGALGPLLQIEDLGTKGTREKGWVGRAS